MQRFLTRVPVILADNVQWFCEHQIRRRDVPRSDEHFGSLPSSGEELRAIKEARECDGGATGNAEKASRDEKSHERKHEEDYGPQEGASLKRRVCLQRTGKRLQREEQLERVPMRLGIGAMRAP